MSSSYVPEVLLNAASGAARWALSVGVAFGALSGADGAHFARSARESLGLESAQGASTTNSASSLAPASAADVALASLVGLYLTKKAYDAMAQRARVRRAKKHLRLRASARRAALDAAQKNFQFVGVSDREVRLDDVDQFCKEMRVCADASPNLPLEVRRQQLLAIRAMFTENEEAIKAALREDLGRTDWETLTYDILLPLNELDGLLANLEHYATTAPAGQDLVSFPAAARLQPDPLGLVLVIGTWNFPVMLTMVPVMAAVAAGNSVVLKPSNVSPAIAKVLDRLISQYLDPRIVSCVGTAIEGDRHTTAKLLDHKWDHVFFTGSPSVGKVVYEKAARFLTPCTLELGGKNPVFVDKSANVKLAAKRIIWGRGLNCGQQCIAPDTVFCHADVAEEFEGYCKYFVEKFYQGEKSKTNGRLGKIVGAAQFRRVLGMLQSHKGRVVVGGDHDDSIKWISPTVVSFDDFGDAALDEETFGPILWVVRVKSMEVAIEYQEKRPSPLSCYIFAHDQDVIDSITLACKAGGVTVNATLWHAAHEHLPFGGVGESGLGGYHGEASFRIFSHNKPILEKAAWGVWPYDLGSDPWFLYPDSWDSGFTMAVHRSVVRSFGALTRWLHGWI